MMHLHETRSGGQRTPLGIHVAGGALAAVGATVLAALVVPTSATFGRLAVVALAAGVFAAVVPSAAASLATGALGFLLFIGFLVNDYGELTWDGERTQAYLLFMTLAVALGLGQRWMRSVLRADGFVQRRGRWVKDPSAPNHADADAAQRAATQLAERAGGVTSRS